MLKKGMVKEMKVEIDVYDFRECLNVWTEIIIAVKHMKFCLIFTTS
jgi:hypothetical protein